MVGVTQKTLAAGPAIGQVTRPARALIGWMSQQEAALVLGGRDADRAKDPELVARAAAAIEAVARRPAEAHQEAVLAEPEADLQGHIAEFESQPSYDSFRREGWEVKMCDLSKVCALQPVVFWDHAEERAQAAAEGDILSLAQVTLPVRSEREKIPLQFDHSKNTWMVVSRNPNLRIEAPFNSSVKRDNGEEFSCCGFLFAIAPSFVQVALHRGRYVLRDGYHRSLGLLARGFTHVPVLFRHFSDFDDLGLGTGMLAQSAYLGEKPPRLSDYLSSEVSAEVDLPASQKVLVIQGMMMKLLG